MKAKELTLKEYEEMLKQHDWYYMMSEDYNVYKRGCYRHSELQDLAKTKELKALFKKYQDKHKIN